MSLALRRLFVLPTNAFINYQLKAHAMGNLKGLELLLSMSGEQKTDSSENSISHQAEEVLDPRKSLKAPGELSGLALAYAVHESEGAELIGSPGGAFAYFFEETNKLVVVSENDDGISHVPLQRLMNVDALDIAKDECASFFIHEGAVICNIRGFSESGNSYGEAALRCGFNRWMQHTINCVSRRSVANEAETPDLLHG